MAKKPLFFADYIIQRFGTNNDCNKQRYPAMQNISYEFFNGMLFFHVAANERYLYSVTELLNIGST